MTPNTLLLILTIFQFGFAIGDRNPLVLLPNGLIRGREAVTIENKTYYTFQKIPYATPPTGELRFKPPQPAQNWDGILNTTNIDVICYQTTSNSSTESEDCLFINVFTPKLPSENNSVSLPVLFYIHGGGFVEGSSLYFQPDLFINNDIVFASINYRVGVFGFLSTQDEVVPGNMGLKDQLLALQWAHDNIKLFGGDPEKITIYGESAGSASCAYHLLNQQSVGLFRGAILGSGSFLSPWAYQRRAREIAFKTASFLNSTFETNDYSVTLFEYLQSVEATDLDAAAEKYHNMEYGPEDIEISQGFYWAPVVEVKNPDAFLTKKMYGLLKAGNVVKVPILIGMNSEEGLSFNQDASVLQSTMETYDKNLAWLVPNDMRITDDANRTKMGRLIRELYTGGEPLADHLGDGVRYSSDTSFTRSIIKHAELHSTVAKTYFYQFSYDGKLPNFDIHYDGADSVCHGEEIQYIFCSGTTCDISGYPESDQLVRKRLVEILVNFIRYQNPTPEPSDLLQNIIWPLVSIDNGDLLYVDIGENLEIRNHPKNNTYGKWVELYNSLSYDDFDTY